MHSITQKLSRGPGDGSPGRGAYAEAWQPKFHLQMPQGGENELSSNLHSSAMAHHSYTQIINFIETSKDFYKASKQTFI